MTFRWPFKNQIVSEDEKIAINRGIGTVRQSLWSLNAFGVEDEDERQAYLNVLQVAIDDLGSIRLALIEKGQA